MAVEHRFQVEATWQGNRGPGTTGYRDYGREVELTAPHLPAIPGSAARVFHGHTDRWNPEQLLIGALAQCHLLSFLHVAVSFGVVVLEYTDAATGTMQQTPDGGGQFTEVTLRPHVVIADPAQLELMPRLHAEASAKCFIARSVNFPVRHEPRTDAAGPDEG